MKKLVLAFGLLTILFAFPVSAAVDFSVINVSQDNADATRVGVRAGDVLRYEIAITGEDLNTSVETVVDLRDALADATMVNKGGGTLSEPMLSFPENFCFTCDEQVFSFWIRANDECVNGETIDMTFDDQTLIVPVHCELADSGPGSLIIAALALVLFMGYAVLSWRKPC